LQDELNDNNDRKANLSGAITQVEGEIAAREAELKSLSEEVEQAKTSLTKLNQENTQYQARLDAAKKQFDTLTARIGENLAAVTKLLEKVPAVPAEEVARFGERP
jgi:chromosome segregation ATPase